MFNVGLLISSKIPRQEKQTTLKEIDAFKSKLHDICPEDLYNNTIKILQSLIHLQQELQC